MAHIRQTRPDSGLGFHRNVTPFQLFPLRSATVVYRAPRDNGLVAGNLVPNLFDLVSEVAYQGVAVEIRQFAPWKYAIKQSEKEEDKNEKSDRAPRPPGR